MSMKTQKRILSDIKELNNDPLYSNGIYHYVNEENIFNMKALIIGQENTVYHGGFYFFDINFPNTYPNEPPKVKFLNYLNNSVPVRFNPNLYTCGKVCLSLLNTWAGDQWSPINTVSSVLLSIQAMVLINNPLHNEPGYEEDNGYRNTGYNKAIRTASIVEMIKNIEEIHNNSNLDMFSNIVKKYFYTNYDMYRTIIDNYISDYQPGYDKVSIYENKLVFSEMYNFSVLININVINTKMKKLIENLSEDETLKEFKLPKSHNEVKEIDNIDNNDNNDNNDNIDNNDNNYNNDNFSIYSSYTVCMFQSMLKKDLVKLCIENDISYSQRNNKSIFANTLFNYFKQ